MKEIKQHISPELIEQFHKNELSQDDYFMVLEHISNCTFCADNFAQSFDKTKLIQSPHYLKDNVLEKAHRKVILPIPSIPKLSHRKQLLFYSAKVCAATLGALVLLFFSTNIDIPNTKALAITAVDSKVWENINQSLDNFSSGMSQQLDSLVSFSHFKDLD